MFVKRHHPPMDPRREGECKHDYDWRSSRASWARETEQSARGGDIACGPNANAMQPSSSSCLNHSKPRLNLRPCSGEGTGSKVEERSLQEPPNVRGPIQITADDNRERKRVSEC